MKPLPVSPRWIGWIVLLALIALVGSAWGPIAWGTTVAVVLWPLRTRLWSRPIARRLPHVLPVAVALAVIAGLVVPVLWALWTLVNDLATTVWAWTATGSWPSWWETLWSYAPQGGPWMGWKDSAQQALLHLVGQADGSTNLWVSVLGVGANALRWIMDAVWFTATLAWWLYDGERGVRWLETHAQQVTGPTVVNAARQALGTVRGQGVAWLVLGLIEALVMGAALHVMDLPHPWVWGGLAGAMAPIPAVSPVLVLGVAVWAWVHKLPETALLVLGVGALVFLVFDSWARPWLASQTSNLSFGWSLAGVALGLQSVGPLGLFLGPALVSFAFAWVDAIGQASTLPDPDGPPSSPSRSAARPLRPARRFWTRWQRPSREP